MKTMTVAFIQKREITTAHVFSTKDQLLYPQTRKVFHRIGCKTTSYETNPRKMLSPIRLIDDTTSSSEDYGSASGQTLGHGRATNYHNIKALKSAQQQSNGSYNSKKYLVQEIALSYSAPLTIYPPSLSPTSPPYDTISALTPISNVSQTDTRDSNANYREISIPIRQRAYSYSRDTTKDELRSTKRPAAARQETEFPATLTSPISNPPEPIPYYSLPVIKRRRSHSQSSARSNSNRGGSGTIVSESRRVEEYHEIRRGSRPHSQEMPSVAVLAQQYERDHRRTPQTVEREEQKERRSPKTSPKSEPNMRRVVIEMNNGSGSNRYATVQPSGGITTTTIVDIDPGFAMAARTPPTYIREECIIEEEFLERKYFKSKGSGYSNQGSSVIRVSTPAKSDHRVDIAKFHEDVEEVRRAAIPVRLAVEEYEAKVTEIASPILSPTSPKSERSSPKLESPKTHPTTATATAHQLRSSQIRTSESVPNLTDSRQGQAVMHSYEEQERIVVKTNGTKTTLRDIVKTESPRPAPRREEQTHVIHRDVRIEQTEEMISTEQRRRLQQEKEEEERRRIEIMEEELRMRRKAEEEARIRKEQRIEEERRRKIQEENEIRIREERRRYEEEQRIIEIERQKRIEEEAKLEEFRRIEEEIRQKQIEEKRRLEEEQRQKEEYESRIREERRLEEERLQEEERIRIEQEQKRRKEREENEARLHEERRLAEEKRRLEEEEERRRKEEEIRKEQEERKRREDQEAEERAKAEGERKRAEEEKRREQWRVDQIEIIRKIEEEHKITEERRRIEQQRIIEERKTEDERIRKERREQAPAVTSNETMSYSSHRRSESSSASRVHEGTVVRSSEYISSRPAVTTTTIYEKTSGARGYVAGSGLSSYGAHCTVALRSAREKEKGELIYLNDMLADYIEKVRFLEAQNRILSSDLEVMRRGFTGTGIETMCKTELETAKRVISDTVAARSTFESDIGRLGGEVTTWRAKWLEVLKTRRSIRGDLDADLDKLAAVEAEIALAKRRIRLVEEECIGIRQHNTRIGADISRVKSQRDHELIVAREHQLRVQDFLVRVKHFAEEQRFAINECIRYDTTTENREYFRRELQAAMRDIRANYESIVRRNHVEIESWYHQQVRRIEGGIGHAGRGHEAHRMEVTRIRTEVSSLHSQLAQLESRNAMLTAQIQDFGYQAELDHKMYEASLAERDRAIQHMREQCTELTHQMEALCDVQITLEKEIARYRTLIQGANVRTYDAYTTSSSRYVAPAVTTSYKAYESTSSSAHRSDGGGYTAGYSATYGSGGGALTGGYYSSTLSGGGGGAIALGAASGGSAVRESYHESSSYRASSALGSVAGSETKRPERIHDEKEETEDGRHFHRWYKGTVRITMVNDNFVELENICVVRRVDASGLQMRQYVGGQLKTTFTLPDGLILDPKQTIRIYSANSNYPEDAFVANIDYFSIEEDARTSIYNREEEEKAWFVYTS
ncbi:hypothetical protein WR25_04038 [Diploscapter pachys]|uniref:IF rod domain-containing protein n=1 Tax=Diploscapter pachys TaxID=2018661 RepID=A0A2A2KM34_9BILA|nr:hypothetical protein WR25_04038 [Diploscapter pachys]